MASIVTSDAFSSSISLCDEQTTFSDEMSFTLQCTEPIITSTASDEVTFAPPPTASLVFDSDDEYEVVDDFADPEGGIFCGVVTAVERQQYYNLRIGAPFLTVPLVSSQTHRNHIGQPGAGAASNSTRKRTSLSRPSTFSFLRRSITYTVLPKTPKWKIKPLASSTPFHGM